MPDVFPETRWTRIVAARGNPELRRTVLGERATSGPAPDTTPPAEPDFDPAVLAELEAEADADFVRELVTTFVEESRDLIVQIADAGRDHDATGMRRLAHSLKSSSASVGAVALAARARNIEALARDDDLDAAAPLVALLDEEFARAERALTDRTRI